MNKLYEALEICLREIEKGADVNTVLSRYPEIAAELRPILEASVKAKEMAVPAPSQEVVRRSRAKFLQHAAEMRERKTAPVTRRIWSVPLRRALVSFMVAVVLFVSGTGLVRAASTTLPGDNLYPVKRTWEDVSLFLTFDTNERETLELEHENERLDELHELFAVGRSAEVDFSGYVTRQNGTEWRVSGIAVFISPQTRLPNQVVGVGDAVRVKGQTWNGDSVLATAIELLPTGSKPPAGNDNELEIEEGKPENSNQQVEDESDMGSVTETPEIQLSPTSTPDLEIIFFEGVVTSIENNFVVVNGIVMDIRFAQVEGVPEVGIVATGEGYYDSDGVFIAVKIKFRNVSPGDENGSTSDSNTNEQVNDNNNDDSGNNINDNDTNDNNDSNTNDSNGNDNTANDNDLNNNDNDDNSNSNDSNGNGNGNDDNDSNSNDSNSNDSNNNGGDD